jgi:hypothetical protein
MGAKLTSIKGSGAAAEPDADLVELEDILLARTKEILKTRAIDPDDAAVRQIELKTMSEAAKVLSAVVSSRRARRTIPTKGGADTDDTPVQGGLSTAFA